MGDIAVEVLCALLWSLPVWVAAFALRRWIRRDERRLRVRDAHHREHVVDPFVVALAEEHGLCLCDHRLPCPMHRREQEASRG